MELGTRNRERQACNPISSTTSPPPPSSPAHVPLAERMRPRSFDDIVGQQDVLGPGRPLREAIERDRLQSIILWGPPGTGKTTIARLVAERTKARFVSFSAVLAGIKDIKEVMAAAEAARRMRGAAHDPLRGRDPPLQQGAAGRVPAARRGGTIVLIGATTENPSFEVNAALLSRSQVFVLRGLTEEEILEHPRARARPTSSTGSARESCRRTTEALGAHRAGVGRRCAVGAEPAGARGLVGARR